MNAPVETPRTATSEAGSKSLLLGTILGSESRAAGDHTSDPIKNYRHEGVRIFVNVTDVGAAGTVTVKIQVQDPVSGEWVDLTGATTAAIAATGAEHFTLYPGLTAAANDKVDGHLGLTWRVVATVATNAVEFSVGGEYLC